MSSAPVELTGNTGMPLRCSTASASGVMALLPASMMALHCTRSATCSQSGVLRDRHRLVCTRALQSNMHRQSATSTQQLLLTCASTVPATAASTSTSQGVSRKEASLGMATGAPNKRDRVKGRSRDAGLQPLPLRWRSAFV